VWHHRLAEPEFGAWLANELVSMLEAMLADTELRAFRGQKMVEVRPVWANKGEAFERILAGYSQPDFLFAAGDDCTDEDLFERLRDGAWTVHVGPGATRVGIHGERLREPAKLTRNVHASSTSQASVERLSTTSFKRQLISQNAATLQRHPAWQRPGRLSMAAHANFTSRGGSRSDCSLKWRRISAA